MISDTIRSRSSADPNSMTTRPRFLPIWICTRVASCSDRISSTSAMPHRRRWHRAGGGRLRSFWRRPVHVAAHELLDLAHRQVLGGHPQREGVDCASASPSDSSARAWPAWILPSVSSCWTSSGSWSSRIVFAMCDRDTPTRSASSSCFSPSSSRSCRNASASSIGPRSSRWMFSISASRSVSASLGVPHHHRDRGQAGHLGGAQAALPRDQLVAARRTCGPRWAAGSRPRGSRRPATSIASSSKCVRGCLGLGLTALTGTSSSPASPSPASGAPGISADSPRPSPPRFDIIRLPCGTVAIGACGSRLVLERRADVRDGRVRLVGLRVGASVEGPGRLGSGVADVGVLVDDHHPSFGKVPGWGRGAAARRRGRARVRLAVLPEFIVVIDVFHGARIGRCRRGRLRRPGRGARSPVRVRARVPARGVEAGSGVTSSELPWARRADSARPRPRRRARPTSRGLPRRPRSLRRALPPPPRRRPSRRGPSGARPGPPHRGAPPAGLV